MILTLHCCSDPSESTNCWQAYTEGLLAEFTLLGESTFAIEREAGIGEVLLVVFVCLTGEDGIDFGDFLSEDGAVEFMIEGEEEGGVCDVGVGGFDAVATLANALVLTHWLFRKNTVL